MLKVPLPIPLELLRGLDFQLADTERLQPAYLLGQTQLGGWWYWYAAAFLLKVPLPALVLFLLALARLPTVSRGCEPVVWAGLCVVVPAVEMALTVSATTGTGTNAAFRYLLPSLGLMCIIAGCAWNSQSRSHRIAAVGLLAWLMLGAVAAAPDHLGAENEAAWAWRCLTGRPALIGDSLDWGQDLARLGRWVSRHEGEGGTMVCVYGLGIGAPYGLVPPAAQPGRPSQSGIAYLAISEQALFGGRSSHDVTIAGTYPDLTPELANRLSRVRPVERVGRTICIYRLLDLMSPGATGF